MGNLSLNGKARSSATAPVFAAIVLCGAALLAADGAPFGLPPAHGFPAVEDEARYDAQTTPTPSPTTPENHQALRELITARDWDGVASALARSAEQSPDDPEIHYWRGLLLGADDPAAVSDLRRALESETLRPQAQAALDALLRNPSAPLAERWTALGVALVGAGEWAWAHHAFDAALAADPLHVTALAYRGFAKDRQGLDGLADIEAAQALGPRDPAGYYFAGLHWRAAGDYAASHQAFLAAYFLAPDNPALAAEVGGALELLGAYSEAEPWYRMAVELAPDEPSWYALLARFYVDSGYRPDDAAFAFVEAAAARFEQDADLAASLGWALFQQGEHQRAYDALNRALTIAPDSVRARYYFGLALERLGDREGAADSLWFVLDTAGPGDAYGLRAARALQRLGFPIDAQP